MISFRGDGGGGGGGRSTAGVIAGAALLSATTARGGWFVASAWPPFESDPEDEDAESFELRDLDFLLGVATFPDEILDGRVKGEACATAVGAAAATPTCRLLTTVRTPSTDAACRPAASRCAALSTAPPRVTTPSLACTVSCFVERPESWLNLP